MVVVVALVIAAQTKHPALMVVLVEVDLHNQMVSQELEYRVKVLMVVDILVVEVRQEHNHRVVAEQVALDKLDLTLERHHHKQGMVD
jgi:hypothetical protein|tara:strand:- start:492 stop:752 length:261 start_codon:yes stop_codon:yes gene_type:complete